MIGKVTVGDSNFTLEDDGTVTCDDAGLASVVTQEFRWYTADYSPAMGSFGVAWLHDMAAKLGGKATIEPKPESPEGLVL